MKHVKFSVLVHTPVTAEPFDPPRGVTYSEPDVVIYFDTEGLSLLAILIEVGRDVAAPVFAAWLYDRFVSRKPSKPAKQTKLNERVITFGTRDEFIQLVERELTQTKDE